MRVITVILASLVPLPVLAGYVVHPQPGDPNPPAIVAIDSAGGDHFGLDPFGQAWRSNNGVNPWVRYQAADPTVPVSDLLFWSGYYFVTTAGETFGRLTGGWTSIGYPPSVSGLASPGAGDVPMLLTAPNPSTDATRIAFSLSSPGAVRVRLFDASGRLVRTLLEGELPAGPVSLTWDGHDDRGEDLPVGVYFSRVETAVGTTAGRVVIAR